MSSSWNPKAFADENTRNTLPVSAFFLIDSFAAIDRCLKELERFRRFGMPPMEGSEYIQEVREIYRTQRVVRNFDCPIEWRWQGEMYPGVIRYHAMEGGKYEIELWLPGVIANELKDHFSDGTRGFFCGFMPPGFYD